MRDRLSSADWSQFRQVDRQHLQKLDKLLSEDMTRLMQVVPGPGSAIGGGGGGGMWREQSEGNFNGPVDAIINAQTPFRRDGTRLPLSLLLFF